MGNVQYMFDFVDPCGVMFRFDHLAELSPEFVQYASQLPEPKPDDSRSTPFKDAPFIKKGARVATAAGSPANPGFDFGVYDLRQPNPQSKTELFKTDDKRVADKNQSYFALCWFDLLPQNERTVVNSLPLKGGAKESTSDYCS
jgi:hypothetical protein